MWLVLSFIFLKSLIDSHHFHLQQNLIYKHKLLMSKKINQYFEKSSFVIKWNRESSTFYRNFAKLRIANYNLLAYALCSMEFTLNFVFEYFFPVKFNISNRRFSVSISINFSSVGKFILQAPYPFSWWLFWFVLSNHALLKVMKSLYFYEEI